MGHPRVKELSGQGEKCWPLAPATAEKEYEEKGVRSVLPRHSRFCFCLQKQKYFHSGRDHRGLPKKCMSCHRKGTTFFSSKMKKILWNVQL